MERSSSSATRNSSTSSFGYGVPVVQGDRVFAISDLHTDLPENWSWLQSSFLGGADHSKDALLIAGDISHSQKCIKATLQFLLRKFATVVFVPGNHELWLDAREDTCVDSLAKFDAVLSMCRKLGVHTGPVRVGGGHCLLLPLFSWYDDSLHVSLTGTKYAKLDDEKRWRALWNDYRWCVWPAASALPVQHFARINSDAMARCTIGPGEDVISFSHFLPRKQCLPIWRDHRAEAPSEEWLVGADENAQFMGVNFSRVAGTASLDVQLRRAEAQYGSKRMHIFGHSHRPKDFSLQGVRYVSHPLGYGEERDCIRREGGSSAPLLVWENADRGGGGGREVAGGHAGGDVAGLTHRLSGLSTDLGGGGLASGYDQQASGSSSAAAGGYGGYGYESDGCDESPTPTANAANSAAAWGEAAAVEEYSYDAWSGARWSD